MKDSDFYVGVTSTNAKKKNGSEAYYNVEILRITDQKTDALTDAAPSAGLSLAADAREVTSQVSELGMAGLGTDALSDASGLAGAALSDDKSAWLNIASLA